MGGFAAENLQHNFNGLTYGLDNWIYAVNGGNSGKPFWWGDTASVIDLRGQDFRFHIGRHKLERIGESSGGFGLGMDEWGHLYETHNLTHISHLVFPDRYLKGQRFLKDHTLENISDHEEEGLARIYPIGEQVSRVNHPEQSGYFSGSCGITYYGGGLYGPEYEHTVWVADVVLNLVHVDKVSPLGASQQAARLFDKREFLASTDRSFRPVKMTTGPDGSLYVIDMYRQVIEHPEWIPDEIEKTLNLEAGKDKGRIYKINKTGTRAAFDSRQLQTVEGMIAALAHPNQWLRIQAQRLLVDQTLTENQTAALRKLLDSEKEVARLHALWILHEKQQLQAEELIRALEDQVSGVRENALLIAEERINTERFVKEIIKRLNDPDVRVRMQAALTLSTLTDETFTLHKNELTEAYVAAASAEMDDWNVAALSLASQKEAAGFFHRLLASGGKVDTRLLTSLSLMCADRIEDLKEILGALPAAALPAEVKRDIIHQLTEGDALRSGASLLPLLRELEQKGDRGIVSELSALRRRLALPPSPEFLAYSREALRILADPLAADSIREQQMALIEWLPYKQKSELLYSCLQNTQPLGIQEQALRQLSKFQEPEIGRRVVSMWKTLSPQTRRYASDLLLYIETHHAALLAGLENGTINIGEMNFDLERRRMLLWWTDNEDTKRRAEALFSDAGVTNRKDAIEKMKPALTLAASATNGEKVFTSVCSNCHMYGAQGKEVGPILTEINRKSKESIMHDILDPNAAADTKYITHRLETRAGDLHMGIVEAETDQYITLKKPGGEKVRVHKSEIKTFQSTGSSLMMEGLENSMSTQEMADLLAYLQNGK
ncbi:MAG: hypothetical protein EAZ89_04280 [Bacteroidetes bacterium]|nr:MAG: hypothetical protein EAZ89_04280 [Bacteroidota bacterium]